MMHDEETAGTRCFMTETKPEKFWPKYKVRKIVRVETLGGNI